MRPSGSATEQWCGGAGTTTATGHHPSGAGYEACPGGPSGGYFAGLGDPLAAGLRGARRFGPEGQAPPRQARNVTAEEFESFLRDVQRNLRRPLMVVLDRWSVHRQAARSLQADRRFRFEWLPAYAPDLNPVEQVWNHTQYADLANCVPDDVLEPECAVDGPPRETRQAPELLRSFFHAAELEL